MDRVFENVRFVHFPSIGCDARLKRKSSSKRSHKAIFVHIAWTTACFWLWKTLLLRKWTTFGCIMQMQNAFALWHPWPLFANSLIFRRALLYPLEEGFRHPAEKGNQRKKDVALLYPLEEGFRQYFPAAIFRNHFLALLYPLEEGFRRNLIKHMA